MIFSRVTKESLFDAVILGDGDFPKHPYALSALIRAPYVCCCDGAGAKLIAYGLMPDAIVGDGDSLSDDFKKRYQPIIHIVKEQEDNDQTKSTRHCSSLGYRHIAYLGMTGKREDHTLGNISLLCRYMREFDIRPVMITDHGYFIPACGDNTFESFCGQQISIFNINSHSLTGEGFRWAPYTYNAQWQGTLNESLGDKVSIHADGDYLLFMTHEGKQPPTK